MRIGLLGGVGDSGLVTVACFNVAVALRFEFGVAVDFELSDFIFGLYPFLCR